MVVVDDDGGDADGCVVVIHHLDNDPRKCSEGGLGLLGLGSQGSCKLSMASSSDDDEMSPSYGDAFRCGDCGEGLGESLECPRLAREG